MKLTDVHRVGEQTARLSRKNHDVAMDETSSKTCRSQVRIFLRRRHPHVPNLLPRQVKQLVRWIHAGVMGRHGIPGVEWNSFRFGEVLVQPHVVHEDREVVVQVRLLVVPHVTKPCELVGVAQQHVIAEILFLRAVVEVFAAEAHVEAKAGHQLGDSVLRRYECMDVVGLQPGAALADENVVDVHEDHPVEADA